MSHDLIAVRKLVMVLAGWLTLNVAVAQPQLLTLEETVLLAQQQSVAAQQVRTQFKTNYWKYRSFLADYKPQLSLDGYLPSFTRSYTQVTQPDGTINFVPISNNNSLLNLALTQNIPMTGGSVFVQKQLQRFDDFQRNNTLYNGIPFAVGIQQPLFRFNTMKWDRKIEPIRYQESNQQAIEGLEQVSVNVTSLYFDLLVSQVNLQIAEKNRSNNDTLYKIAQEKMKLGKLSQNDLLQLQLGLLTAQKDLASARQTAEVATLKLKTYIGYRDQSAARALVLDIPSQLTDFTVDMETALKQAFSNRSAAIAFQRRKLEADRDLDKAKRDNGLNATLNAAFGLSNRGQRPTDIYRQPQDREFLEVQFTLPIMTWGRAQARTETARANQQFVEQAIQQDRLTFEQEIYTQVTLLQMLRQQVKLTAEADKIGSERYQIAQNRFLLSDLSVTDLGIATQEKDRARRDYILALRDYWQAYYSLRLLTLYDFERNEKLK